MYANRHHAARPSALTAADRARMAAAVRRADELRARAVRRERVARLAVIAAVIVAAVAMFYAASEPAPLPPEVTGADWSAHDLNGDAMARGLTFADCVARFADCRRERN